MHKLHVLCVRSCANKVEKLSDVVIKKKHALKKHFEFLLLTV
jgi:hypothetical protein